MSGLRRLLLPGLVALLLGLAAPAAAQTEPAPTAELALVERPAWVAPEDEATFLITTSGAVEGTTVRVEVFSALDSVEELEESAIEDVGVRLALAPPVEVGLLPPGRDDTRVVSLRVSAEPTDIQTVQLVEPGVHPVVITLLGPDGAVLDEVRTPLVRLPADPDEWEVPDLAVLLDLAATPSLQPDGTRAIPAAELDRIRRVGALLDDHPDLDLSLAAVPDTVDALGTLADPAAATVLERFRGRHLVAAPYVPLPVGRLVDADLAFLVAPLLERGEAVLADRLGVDAARDVWAGTTAIGTEGARLLAELGYESIVVEAPLDDDLDEGEVPPLPDAGPRPIEGIDALDALVADPVLADQLAGAADDVDAAHVALARLLLRPLEEDPGGGEDATTVLVRIGALAAEPVLAGLLELLTDPESPIEVGGLALVDDEVDDDADAIVLPVGTDPALGDVAERVRASAGQLETFQGLIGAETSRADDLRLQLATAVATTTPDDRRDVALDVVEEVLGSAFGSVRIGGERNLNLTSRRGTLPVTIENANPFPVDLVVRARSDRLRFPDGEEVPVTVAAEDVLRIDVPVEALATGSVPVSVELWTPDGEVRLDGRQLNVRSTAISGVGLVLSLGALAVLVVWWVRSWRRTRHERATAAAPGSGTVPDPMG